MSKIFVIAGLTCREAIRKLFFQIMLLVSLAMLALSLSLSDFDLSGAKDIFIQSFGFGIIYIFGTLMAVVVTAQTIGDEIEQRTYLTLLSKPVSPFHFVFGKFLGIAVLMLFFVLLLLIQTRFLMWMESAKLIKAGATTADFSDFWSVGFGQCIRIMTIVSITMFFASYSTSYVFTIVASVLFVSLGQIRSLMAQLAQEGENATAILSRYLLWLVPDLQRISDVPKLGYESVLYGMLTIIMFILLSCWSFSKRTV